MAPENKEFVNELNEIRQAEEDIRNKNAEIEIVGEIFGKGGRREGTGYKWKIEKEFENNCIDLMSGCIIPEPFFKRVTGGSGYEVPDMHELEVAVGWIIQNQIEVMHQPIRKEYFDIEYTNSKRGTMIFAQMVSMEQEGLEKLFGCKFEKLISEYPEYFEIKDLDEYQRKVDSYSKFSFLRNMPQREQNSFLKDADSRYYFLISLESNKKSHPALKAFLDTLDDLRDRKVLARKREIEDTVKSVLHEEDDSDID